jgi:biofilm PGA synthesis N-glycosyltransferase PgaC
LILYLWTALLSVFVGCYLLYFAYLRRRAKGYWGFEIDSQFCPSVSIIVPAFNEEKLIQGKLENLKEISYPKDKMEVILVDDASTDQTLAKTEEFVGENPELQVKILHQARRQGKANALNAALNACSAGIIIVTDADTLLPADILSKTLPYMSNPTIGALSGVGEPRNPVQSWVANAEKNYLKMMSIWRLGESKIHSTFRFEGCLCAFRRNAFQEFDSESGADDSGTALRIIQNGFRAILVPEARIPAHVPHKMIDSTRAKTRRAVQLAGLWAQCLRLLVTKRLKLPKKIAIPEIFLSLFMPFIFVALVGLTFLLLAYYPIPIAVFVAALCLACIAPKVRSFLVRGILDQFILFYAILLYVRKKRFVIWDHSR